jgi:hypothetical protein
MKEGNMRNKKILFALILLSAGLLLSPQPVLTVSTTFVTGAGKAPYSNGVQYNGVPLNGLRFGFGVNVNSLGTGSGDFAAVLTGTVLNQAREITVEGKAAAGSISSGTATFSGSCSVDMGNGTPAVTNVPFIATATGSSLTLTLGGTSLPATNVSNGVITIR